MTQALFGEVMDVLPERSEGWAKVRLHWQKHLIEGQYVSIEGWIPIRDIVTPASHTRKDYTTNMVVLYSRSGSFTTTVFRHSRADGGHIPIGEYQEGALLPKIGETDDEVFVLLPDGGEGAVRASDTRPLLTGSTALHAEYKRNAHEYIQKYNNRPFLYGGLHADGIDFSGYVYLAARLAGTIIPRNFPSINGALNPWEIYTPFPEDLQDTDAPQSRNTLREEAPQSADEDTFETFLPKDVLESLARYRREAPKTTQDWQVVWQEVYPDTPASGPTMYSIHLGSMLQKGTTTTLLNAVRHIRLPVYITIRETAEGQFFAIHAGLFANPASARASLANTPILSRAAKNAAVRQLPAESIPYSPQGRLFGVQVMSVRRLDFALDTMRTLARLGLGPVLRYVPLRDGHFWSVIHCDLTPDRNEAMQSVRSLGNRSQWKPILSSFP
jgi:hypothetical protein